jgi:hypothetical protein
MKRRCAVLAITRHFRHNSAAVRYKAYFFCQDLIDHPEASKSYPSGMFVESSLVESVAACALVETDHGIQLLAVALLRKITHQQAFPSATVMKVIRDLTHSGKSDNVVVECGAAFCEGMRKEPFPTRESLATVVDFTIFPFQDVRTKAFSTLEVLLTKTENVDLLLRETDLMENFGFIVSEGSDQDCEAALNIVRQLSRSSRNHPKLCEHSKFLGVVVDFVVEDNVSSRIAHFYGVEILLAIRMECSEAQEKDSSVIYTC